jgi:hypothetical protein
MTYVNSSWAFKRGQLVRVADGGTLIGVVLEVANPGIVRVRWGTDDYAGWYSSNDLVRVALPK